MDSPECTKDYGKWETEDGYDVKSDRGGDDEEFEGSNKRKHRSNRSRRPSNGDDPEGLDSSGRRSHRDRNDIRKRSGGSSRAGSDEDGYDSRRELRSKQIKKKQEESTLEKLSSWYQDGELDSRQDAGGKTGNKGSSRADDSERRKISLKFSEHESSEIRSKGKEERSLNEELQRTLDKDSQYSEKRETSREKGHGSSEQVRTSRRRWDETDPAKTSDAITGKASDPKHEGSRERGVSAKKESKGLESNSDKAIKSNNKEEVSVDTERNKSKRRVEALEEDSRVSPVSSEDRLGREKFEKHGGHQKTSTSGDATDGREKSYNADDDGRTGTRDKGSRDVGSTNRSWSPEKSGEHQESELFDVDHERTFKLKQKELEKESYRDDRVRSKDDGRSVGSRDREGSKDNWRRRQPGSSEKDAKFGETVYDHGREWELPRHGRERTEHERPHGRFGNRKDGSRGEAVKTSSKYGISNENYDVIEIQTKPLDFGRAESGSNFSRKTDVGPPDGKSAGNDVERTYQQEGRAGRIDRFGPGTPGEDITERYTTDEGMLARDQNSWRDDFDFQGGKGRGQRGAISGRSTSGPSSSNGSQSMFGSQDIESFNRTGQQGVKGNRLGRGGRGRPIGRDSQQVGIPLPMMGSPFVPLGMPQPGPMQPLTPGMSPAPGPPVSPGVFMPPFSPPVWPSGRGVDMSMLSVPPGLSPVPHGSSAPRFPPNIGNPPNPAMFFNQAGPGRGLPSVGPGFNAAGPIGRGTQPDKTPGGWVPQKSSGPPGKAPSRGEQNDYSQNFVDTGMRPQNFIRELELTNVVEDYPKLRELIQKKDEIVANSASPPMYYKCDLKEFELSPEFFGTKFDVILVDPPWEEYAHRAPGVADHMEYWTFEEIMNLKIEAIADVPSFIFLWVGDGAGLEQGRQCLKKWGFRRCEDICWVKTNKNNATPGLRHDSHTLFQHSKEHCLMGIKGTVRRSTDGHIIHANIDTDVIIAEEPPYGSTQKPEDMYRIIEHFALGRRRLELFGEDHNIRSGWLTVGNGLSSSNFNNEAYIKNFADKEGKVWQGGGGRNPPPEAPHLVLTTPDIESLRPKSPMKNQQQLQQQQSVSISLTTPTSSNRRATGNSPHEASSSTPSTPARWASPMEGFKVPLDDKAFDMYGFGVGQGNGDFVDLDSHRQINLL